MFCFTQEALTASSSNSGQGMWTWCIKMEQDGYAHAVAVIKKTPDSYVSGGSEPCACEHI